MRAIKNLLHFIKACCVLGKEPHLDKMNKDMDKIEAEILTRAHVDGEDWWFLRTERRRHPRCE